MNDTPAIELRAVSKSYGGMKAVDDLSLRVEEGVFLTLLGPSGCGKSTILRTIAGFAEPDRGSILVAGHDITCEPAHTRPVKMVFQDYALFPHMSVRRNIGFGCEMQGMSRAAVARRCEELLETIQLPQIADRYPDELSGGQRQRVALARALAPNPDALLLDEPLGALDLRLRQQMQHELKALQRRTRKTFVFVTHDQEEAMSMSDLIAVMNAGRIEQLDTPRNIYLRPATVFAAKFIGSANLFEARIVASEGDTILLAIEGQEWAVPRAQVTSPAMPAVGETAVVVVRPDAIEVGPGSAGDLELKGRLEESMFLGNRVHLGLRTASGGLVQIEAPPSESSDLPGEIRAHFKPGRVAVLAGTYETA